MYYRSFHPFPLYPPPHQKKTHVLQVPWPCYIRYSFLIQDSRQQHRETGAMPSSRFHFYCSALGLDWDWHWDWDRGGVEWGRIFETGLEVPGLCCLWIFCFWTLELGLARTRARARIGLDEGWDEDGDRDGD
jgi:hypothetical protein